MVAVHMVLRRMCDGECLERVLKVVMLRLRLWLGFWLLMRGMGTSKRITDANASEDRPCFLSLGPLLFRFLLQIGILAPLGHSHAILEVIGDVRFSLVPSFKPITAETTIPALRNSFRSFLPSCLNNIVQSGIVEVLDVLS